MFMRKMVRRLTLWALTCTNEWVVDPEVYDMMDRGRLDMASQELDKQELVWSGDPELVRARTMIRFLRD